MENKYQQPLGDLIMSKPPQTPPLPCYSHKRRQRYFGSKQDLRCATRPFVSEQLWVVVSDKLYGKVTTMWDAFCGIGVDTIQATRFFQRVFATEIDESTYEKFCHNIRLKQVSRMILSSCQMDCLQVQEVPFHIDLLYFDPPWGSEYPRQKAEKGQFQFGNTLLNETTTIANAYTKLVEFARPKYTLVKLPANASHGGPWLHGSCEDHDDDPATNIEHGCVRLYDQWARDGLVFYLTKC